jgi:hypothetical protein
VSYASGIDALCYPETSVLRNKADIEEQNALDAFELEMVLARSKEQWPVGRLDASHYLSLHHHLFQTSMNGLVPCGLFALAKLAFGFVIQSISKARWPNCLIG